MTDKQKINAGKTGRLKVRNMQLTEALIQKVGRKVESKHRQVNSKVT